MTVYKAIKLEAEAAAELAVALAKGRGAPSTMTLSKVNNSTKDVPSVLLPPVAVTKDNIKTTVVADGFWTTAQIDEHACSSRRQARQSVCSDRSFHDATGAS